MRDAAIPVTVIGGYLGAGKTTLVNAILAGAHGRRIGVLVNDFGAISIDTRLIAAREGDVVTLANGCACCSVAGDLGEALDRVAAVASPEHILIEASGVADPAKIAALARSPGLAPRAPVVMADAAALIERSRDKFVGKLVRRQLARGRLVILNKIDLAGAEILSSVRAFVWHEAPDAVVVETAHAKIDVDFLLDAEASALGSAFACDEGGVEAKSLFASHSWSSTRALDPGLAMASFDALPSTILRAKGLFASLDGAFEIHRAADRTDIRRLDSSFEGAAFAFIGRAGAIQPQALDAMMNACIEGPART
ncbi:MAG: GTP-binding protein [Rhodoblastus sp.]|nr:GTP-binding protein [Rhodoblastus sp.]